MYQEHIISKNEIKRRADFYKMMTATTGMIAVRSFFSLVAGAICGAFYIAVFALCQALLRVIGMNSLQSKKSRSNLHLGKNIFDFLFFFCTGVLHILIGYVFCDGIFDIYSLLALILGFISGKGIISVLFRHQIVLKR